MSEGVSECDNRIRAHTELNSTDFDPAILSNNRRSKLLQTACLSFFIGVKRFLRMQTPVFVFATVTK